MYLYIRMLRFPQVSFYALRVAVGLVSHVDLPLDDLLAALTQSASDEVLSATDGSIFVPGFTEGTPLLDESAGVAEREQRQRLQEAGYAALCRFMEKVETPSSSCCRPLQCSSCGSSLRNRCICVSWRGEMVRVRNGRGGLVWVKRTNETDYKEKTRLEAARSRTPS